MSDPDGTSNQRIVGRWSDRVAFSESGGFAYRPGELFVPPACRRSGGAAQPRARPSQRESPGREDLDESGLSRFTNVVEELRAIDHLRREHPDSPEPRAVLALPVLLRAAPGALLGQSVHGESVHRESVHGQSVHGQSVHRESVHGQSVHGQSVHRESVHRESVHRESVWGQGLSAESARPSKSCHARPEVIEFGATGWRPHSSSGDGFRRSPG